MIGFHDAEYSIKGRRIVGPLRLEVARGETVVLLGESGSGKSTTLRLVNRLLVPTAGEVCVDARPTVMWDPVRLRRTIGYVIQDVGLLPHLDVIRNVGLVPRLEGWPPDRIEGRVEAMLRLVGLDPGEMGARLPRALSGGQRQRVGVARALAADPPILLCDEPFGALDSRTRADVLREFAALIRRLYKTVVFVTHDVREALTLADRIVVLSQGRIVYAGTPDEFRHATEPAVLELRDQG